MSKLFELAEKYVVQVMWGYMLAYIVTFSSLIAYPHEKIDEAVVPIAFLFSSFLLMMYAAKTPIDLLFCRKETEYQKYIKRGYLAIVASVATLLVFVIGWYRPL